MPLLAMKTTIVGRSSCYTKDGEAARLRHSIQSSARFCGHGTPPPRGVPGRGPGAERWYSVREAALADTLELTLQLAHGVKQVTVFARGQGRHQFGLPGLGLGNQLGEQVLACLGEAQVVQPLVTA